MEGSPNEDQRNRENLEALAGEGNGVTPEDPVEALGAHMQKLNLGVSLWTLDSQIRPVFGTNCSEEATIENVSESAFHSSLEKILDCTLRGEPVIRDFGIRMAVSHVKIPAFHMKAHVTKEVLYLVHSKVKKRDFWQDLDSQYPHLSKYRRQAETELDDANRRENCTTLFRDLCSSYQAFARGEHTLFVRRIPNTEISLWAEATGLPCLLITKNGSKVIPFREIHSVIHTVLRWLREKLRGVKPDPFYDVWIIPCDTTSGSLGLRTNPVVTKSLGFGAKTEPKELESKRSLYYKNFKPCNYFQSRGCKSGKNCKFLHINK
eukprot:TRINITY_DN14659_c0_g1_i1.p1 TRINITY_DN14659_c0_g1~~TRINITY_DN14659_c0_g1_i1.p1  ORF type:complete len:329 (+),score=28.45 TRINITY_DN14659_c0_g1_i1:28-987(+)